MYWSDLILVVMIAAACSKPPRIETVKAQPCRIEDGERVIDLECDAAGHEITRREHRGSYVQTWSFRYTGDKLAEQILDGAAFRFDYDAAGHHVATTLRQHTMWRGEYEGNELRVSQDIRVVGAGADTREVPGTSTAYTYDRFGRVTRAVTSLSIGGTVTRTYAYNEATCRYIGDTLWLPGETVFVPCPTTITTVDDRGTRVSHPVYRDGRLVQDDDYTYVYDEMGRLDRMTSQHRHDLVRRFSYSCGAP